MPSTARVIAFDVNGTMLELRPLKAHLQRAFGGGFTIDEWFAQIIQYAMATSLSGDYREFGDIAISVLKMAASARGIKLSERQQEAIRQQMRDLPAYAEVKRSLKRLRDAGFTLIALSNSGTAALQAQLRNAGIAECFDHRVSVEQVKRFKPAPEPYREAARIAKVQPADLLMVAAHPWDLMGAARAGCQTAFVRRPGFALFPGTSAPDYAVEDFTQLADNLAGRKSNLLMAAGGIAMAVGFAIIASRDRKHVDGA